MEEAPPTVCAMKTDGLYFWESGQLLPSFVIQGGQSTKWHTLVDEIVADVTVCVPSRADEVHPVEAIGADQVAGEEKDSPGSTARFGDGTVVGGDD